MASFVRESKFRNIVTALSGREQWYEQLKTADIASDGGIVASSSAFLAYPDVSGGKRRRST